MGIVSSYVEQDILNIGEAVNEDKIVTPRYGAPFKSLPMVSFEAQENFTAQQNELQDAIDIALAAGAGAAGWTDSLIQAWTGNTQAYENKRMSKARLGQKLLYETPALSIDTDSDKYPQGGCKVGDSLFVKIGNNVGTVGTSTEEFIIAEYDFETGVLISQSPAMQTLGHHELSGFIKDGKTYLVTSYQPASAGGRSGVGVSVIEWKGGLTTLSYVQQYEILDTNQTIGFPAVDENGEYVYIINVKDGSSSGSGLLLRAPILNVCAYKLSEVQAGRVVVDYSFNIEIPAGDGLIGSNSLNGFSATKDHLHIVFGGAYGVAQIYKYTTNGDFIEKILTAHSRAARPQSEIITEDLFLYNTEPEGCFVDNGNVHLVCAEIWYGAGEFVSFNGKFYMARYGMTGKSPASHADHWVKVPFTPASYTAYNASTAYLGRDILNKKFVRTVIKISLKDSSNYDLMMPDSVGEIPNLINNIADQVHIYGNLLTGNILNFGHYDYQRQTFQKNMSMTENGLRLFDTRYTATLSEKSSSFQSYHSSPSSNLFIVPDDDYQNEGLRLYGRYHGDATETTPHVYVARLESDGAETAAFYRDGRLYNYSKHASVAAKFFMNGVEILAAYGNATTTYIDTENTYMWFGKSSGGVHGSATLGMNHDSKTVYPPTDGATAMGMRGQAFKVLFAKDIVLAPAASATPVNNGEMTVQATSNTQLTFKLKGSDGVVRSGTLTLS